MKQSIEKRLSLILSWGIIGVTLIVTDRLSTEPANYGKAALLCAVAFSAMFLSIRDLKEILSIQRVLFIIILGFLASQLSSVLLSENAFSKGIFGTFGRSTGFLTYLSLTIILVLCSTLRESSSYLLILRGLFYAGSVNLILSITNMFGFDILTWQNPNLLLLGTLGNTNFVGSFLGIYFTLCIILLFFSENTMLKSVLLLIVSFVTLYAILRTDALQGLVVSSLGLVIVFGFYIKSRFSKFYLYSYSLSAIAAFVGAALGTLQLGPLSRYLYKPSVSLRGEYWQAAINMGLDKPLTGVGLDSYGAYFRVYREESALVFPGANVTTDSAHNVFLDFFAGSGLPGFLMYLSLNLFVFSRVIKIWRSKSHLDLIGVGITALWIIYVVQSIISINQIGLAIWGWALAGLIIGYSESAEISTDYSRKNGVATRQFFFPFSSSSQNKNSKSTLLIPGSRALASFVGLILGGLLALLPLLNDAQTRSAIEGKNPDGFRNVANKWPQDTVRDYRLIVEFTKYGRDQDAYDLALTSTKRFPNEFPGWFSLYQLTPTESPNKLVLKRKLHELDPKNPEWQ